MVPAAAAHHERNSPQLVTLGRESFTNGSGFEVVPIS